MESQQLEQQGVSLNAYMAPRVVLNINGVEVTMPPTARMAMTQDHYDPSWDRFGYSLEIDARVPVVRITADEARGWPERQGETIKIAPYEPRVVGRDGQHFTPEAI